MRLLTRLSSILVLILVDPCISQGSLIFQDTFDVGASPTVFDDGDDPHDISWTGSTLTVVDDSLGIGSGNAVHVSGGAWSRVQTDYSDFSLDVGHKAVLSLEARFTDSPVSSTGSGFRFGLYRQSDDHGYFAHLGTGTNTGVSLFEDNIGGNDPGGGGDGGVFLAKTASGVFDGFAAGDVLELEMTYTRTGTDSGLLELSVIDGSNSYFATSTVNSGFNADYGRLVVRKGNVIQEFNVDNLTLAVIVPEPSTFGLSVFFLGFALLRRRRRRSP